MISHDATLVAFELSQCRGQSCSHADLEKRCTGKLKGAFDEAVDNLVFVGAADKQLIAAASSSSLKQLSSSLKLSTTTYIILKAAYSSCSKSRHTHPEEVLRAVRRAIDPRNFHSNYQAVVSGKRARRDPIVEAGKALNPADRAEYWRAIGKLDEGQQEDFRTRLTQPAARRG